MANTLYDALFAPLSGRRTPFLILPDGRAITGDAFLRMVHRAAHAMRAAGVGVGDRVTVQAAKTPEALALYGAAVAAGAVFLPLNTAYTPAEVDYFVGNATPKLLIADPAQAEALAPIAAAHGARLMTLDATGKGSFADLAEGQPDAFTPAERGPGDLAGLLYTSGTTGRSKGAMMSHRNLLSNAEVLVDLWRFTRDDVLLHALPIFHTHGLFVATNTLLLGGGAMIFLPGFDLDTVLRLMPQATAMMGVPTFYTRLLDDARFTRDAAAGMRLFISGSAPLLAETHNAFAARTGHRILERYGMTETNMITSNPHDGDRRAGTVGAPLPGVEVKVTDPATGAALPAGEVGMVEVRGPNVFQGYWQMPEKTKEELRPDGFFITGDLGRFSEDGYLTIVGRQKDLVITGGFNVYPKEVELVLDDQPGVLESAVIGVPHPDFGEAVLAVIVPEKGAAPDLAAIDAALRATLARFKQPKAIELVPALPRNTMGKVQKNELRARYAARFTG
ncbi:malonate--CoA ligase [Ruixingdingia sedimenti]|uniref:Malonyl-CoA synthase n=1 Tax=Ruixingdingia sedimenti TaxID=3073604 RepID=A0ABU1F9I6_9RHOB|nr:malonyl-CoA synthase [Xinfangfangia sp. LG-4]MDR5653248.1 malonyl-CoA synthase [Xinfangfangia sp. LG-4]